MKNNSIVLITSFYNIDTANGFLYYLKQLFPTEKFIIETIVTKYRNGKDISPEKDTIYRVCNDYSHISKTGKP